jgi:single-strand DNA-binding protein
MAYTEQSVSIKGNLGQNAEMRFMPDGGNVTNCSVGTTRYWKDKQSGEQREDTEWHPLVFFDRGNFRLAKLASDLKLGECIRVKGELRTRSWQDKNGAIINNFLRKIPKSEPIQALVSKLTTRFVTEVVVSDLEIIDNQRLRGVLAALSQEKQGQSSPALDAPSTSLNASNFDDDIPF